MLMETSFANPQQPVQAKINEKSEKAYRKMNNISKQPQ